MASRLAVFLAFVQLEHIEFALEALSVHIAGIHPELMAIVNYSAFEQTYFQQTYFQQTYFQQTNFQQTYFQQTYLGLA